MVMNYLENLIEDNWRESWCWEGERRERYFLIKNDFIVRFRGLRDDRFCRWICEFGLREVMFEGYVIWCIGLEELERGRDMGKIEEK